MVLIREDIRFCIFSSFLLKTKKMLTTVRLASMRVEEMNSMTLILVLKKLLLNVFFVLFLINSLRSPNMIRNVNENEVKNTNMLRYGRDIMMTSSSLILCMKWVWSSNLATFDSLPSRYFFTLASSTVGYGKWPLYETSLSSVYLA